MTEVLENEIFKKCRGINELLNQNQEEKARDEVIKLLDFHEKNNIESYSELVNHLIRQVGLFPYMKEATASFEDSLVYDLFRTDVGKAEPCVLHRAQSKLLKKLLSGEDVAVSAPTSFGKSFVIDAFIALKKPQNVVIIVPTIALMDETRRRLYQKFSNEYEVITTVNASLGEKNILVFPQERAYAFRDLLKEIDILIVDEFYKVSPVFDENRSSTLIKCLLDFMPKAKQRYFLAPNISSLKENPLTKNIPLIPIDFKTVFLNIENKYPLVSADVNAKEKVLNEILNENLGKTLIYAGTYTEIKKLTTIFLEQPVEHAASGVLETFSSWLQKNYDANWALSRLVRKGIGIHNGKLHRSLAQIQVRLFDQKDGINRLISTSSIIEGVNTAAENVILWSNKSGKGKSAINFFTYKNIIGRGGRMFRHFVGNVFLLDKIPSEEDTQLTIDFPQDVIFDKASLENIDITEEDKNQLLTNNDDIENELGQELYKEIKNELLSSNPKYGTVKRVIKELRENSQKWKGLNYLNSENVSEWGTYLKQLLFLFNRHWDVKYDAVVGFIQKTSNNWNLAMPQILDELGEYDIGIDEFFSLEKQTTYDFAQFLALFNRLQKSLQDASIDISPFIAKLGKAFLPPAVLQLEEFGLPRMISRKIQNSGIINFEDGLDIHSAIQQFKDLGCERVKSIEGIDDFDKYIIDYFFDGING